jgi:hypothetical protein
MFFEQLVDPKFTALFEQIKQLKEKMFSSESDQDISSQTCAEMRSIHGQMIKLLHEDLTAGPDSSDETAKKVALTESLICCASKIICKCEKHTLESLMEYQCSPLKKLVALAGNPEVTNAVETVLSLKKQFIRSKDFTDLKPCMEMRIALGRIVKAKVSEIKTGSDPAKISIIFAIMECVNKMICCCDKKVLWSRIKAKYPDFHAQLMKGGSGQHFSMFEYLLNDNTLGKHFFEICEMKESMMQNPTAEKCSQMKVALGKFIIDRSKFSNDASVDVGVQTYKIGLMVAMSCVARKIVCKCEKCFMWKTIKEKFGNDFFYGLAEEHIAEEPKGEEGGPEGSLLKSSTYSQGMSTGSQTTGSQTTGSQSMGSQTMNSQTMNSQTMSSQSMKPTTTQPSTFPQTRSSTASSQPMIPLANFAASNNLSASNNMNASRTANLSASQRSTTQGANILSSQQPSALSAQNQATSAQQQAIMAQQANAQRVSAQQQYLSAQAMNPQAMNSQTMNSQAMNFQAMNSQQPPRSSSKNLTDMFSSESLMTGGAKKRKSTTPKQKYY